MLQAAGAYALSISDAEVARYRLMAQVALFHEREFWTRAGIVTDAQVVDIGCGPGEVSALLADQVGVDGRVWAVDSDPASVGYARRLAQKHPSMTVIESDAGATGLALGSVDVAVARHVLVHNGGRERAMVQHMADLLKPGGHLYLVEFEGSAARIRPKTPDLDDLAERYGALHKLRGNDFSIGLRLSELAVEAGLETVEFVGSYRIVQPPPGVRTPTWAARDAIVSAGLATDQDVDRWDAAFAALDELETRPTIFYPVFVCIARKA